MIDAHGFSKFSCIQLNTGAIAFSASGSIGTWVISSPTFSVVSSAHCFGISYHEGFSIVSGKTLRDNCCFWLGGNVGVGLKRGTTSGDISSGGATVGCNGSNGWKVGVNVG